MSKHSFTFTYKYKVYQIPEYSQCIAFIEWFISLFHSPVFKYLLVLKVNGANFIKISCPFEKQHYITVVDLSSNNIQEIFKGTFHVLHNLYHLNLSNNDILFLGATLFDKNWNLQYLDLSNNKLLHTSVSMKPLKSLFSTLMYIHVDKYEVCCYIQIASHAKCEYIEHNIDIIGNCHQILMYWPLRLWLCLSGCATLSICLMSILVCSVTYKVMGKVRSFLGCNLGFADGLLSVYIILLLIADFKATENEGYMSLTWKSSMMCKIMGMILNLSVRDRSQ